MPHFRFGDNGTAGSAQGDGEEGQPVGQRRRSDGDGTGQAGSDPGRHILEVDISLEELAEILATSWSCRGSSRRGKANIVQEKSKYNSIRRGARVAAAFQAHVSRRSAAADFTGVV